MVTKISTIPQKKNQNQLKTISQQSFTNIFSILPLHHLKYQNNKKDTEITEKNDRKEKYLKDHGIFSQKPTKKLKKKIDKSLSSSNWKKKKNNRRKALF